MDFLDFPGKYRGGRKRDNWWIEGIQEYWNHITNTENATYKLYQGTELNVNSKTEEGKIHLAILETAAECRIGLIRETDNVLTTKTKISLGWINSKWAKQQRKTKGDFLGKFNWPAL